MLPLLELEGPGGQAGGREFDFGLAHSDIQGEMLQSLWRRAFGCCGRAGICDVEGVRGRERPVVPVGSALGMRLLDGGNSERQGQPWMSAPTVFNIVIVHVGAE